VLARRDGRLGSGLKQLNIDCAAKIAADRAAAEASRNTGASPPAPQRPDFTASPPECTLRTVGAFIRDRSGDRQGRLDNAGFLDYRVPVASDMPMIEPILVEVPNPAHPYGAKGVGEVNIVPPMAAIANAIDSAIHRRLTELPMSPPRVRAALDHAGADD